MKKTVATSLLCVLALAGCSAAEKASTEKPSPGKPASGTPSSSGGPIAWAPCTDLTGPDGQPAKPDPAVECGKLAVPLDYAKPQGEKLDLALIRVKATGDRLGSLLFNFGGPGASGVTTLGLAAKAFAGLGSRYDLVSFDPRGVDRSAGVKCGGMVEKLASVSDDVLPIQLAGLNKQFVAACEKDSGKVLPYVGTMNAAQDLDQMRQALGDARLNYFGISYGTHLGAVYATKFPKNVGRFVLDGALDPSVTLEQRAVTQMRGFKHAYDDFAADCVKRACALGKDPAAVDRTLRDVLKRMPLDVKGRKLTKGLAQLGMLTALYAKQTWPVLEQAATAAQKGDGNILLALADSYVGRKPDGTYATMMSSNTAINCADTTERPDAAAMKRIVTRATRIFPLLTTSNAGVFCQDWPVKGTDEPKHIDATGSAPILVVGGKGDPATPYEWAPKLASSLKTGVVLTYEGEGHGAYVSGSPCVIRAVDTYFLNGTLPAKPATCPAV
ncbi:alpha/beta hydrolase [Nonomuraea sediminis]|uniref:alpha/beta hydrolase n=1 Tax=Nonomuraea sediminis TaxID=2835864 RepID=UPI001BDBF6C9|nr:alpha/beta hydrolase [Nonomuraea sediminis]